ncbi:nose resistant to fluoxetine protein 6-like [Diabrotica virgifera virgifera]|uniref:Nose resistant-to-fluoxetine protein N-terminal domain-containing protein n=1 Tax=Diabrotica virgifera virgifera TaxID=50390 RepID=A0ABM5IME0_DIAVI|nr:nose resistant to fluoxetine protein 6-like [Diabrotica virgifera virgifera]
MSILCLLLVFWLYVFWSHSSAHPLDTIIFKENVTTNFLEVYIPTVNSNNEICKRHSVFVVEEVKKYTLWATEMLDSTTKFPSGFLDGTNYDFGNFDECINVKVLYEEEPFYGKYCLVKFTLKPPFTVNLASENDTYIRHSNLTMWSKMDDYLKDPSKNPRNVIPFAFCIPSSCTNLDLQKSLMEVAGNFNEQVPFLVDVEVDKLTCQVQTYNSKLDSGDVLFILVIAVVICSAGIGSLYYYLVNRSNGRKIICTGTLHNVLLCFAIQSNTKKLTSANNNVDGLNCTAGMKVFSMILIIFIHRSMFDFGADICNPDYVEQMYSNFWMTFVLNGPILVDTFFTISGFLAAYFALLSYQKLNDNSIIIKLYIHRYIRMVSIYTVILAFYCTLFVKTGNGPLWRERVEVERERCRKSWWLNLFFINNYFNTENYCMFQSWYMACDMNSFILVPILTFILFKKPATGILCIVAVIVASMVVTFVTIYTNDEMPILLIYMRMLLHPSENSTFLRVYIPGHIRASSYFVGVLAGYIKYLMGIQTFEIQSCQVKLGWIMCVLLLFISSHFAFIFYVQTVPTWISALYGALYHVGWSMGIAWIIIAVSSGYGGWAVPILSWSPLVILSRLTYSIYLSHGAIQMYSAGIRRKPVYASTFNSVYAAVADVSLGYTLAFVLTILFEAPIIGLEKILWNATSSKTAKKEDQKADHN